MKPVLDTDSPVVQKLAALALFEQVQETFNLRPSAMAHACNMLARQRSVAPLQLIHPTREKVENLLGQCLQDLTRLINGHCLVTRGVPDKETLDLQSHFNLSPTNIFEGLMSKLKREEMDKEAAVEIIAWLQVNAPIAFTWAFAQTEHILRQEAEYEDE